MAIDTPVATKSWLPTKKWLAALVGGATPIILSALDSGWDKTEEGMLVTLAGGLVLAYIKSNDDTPTGVPIKGV